jgi:hypothetical protein
MYTHTHTHTRRQCLCCIRFSKTIKKSSDSKLGVCVCGRAKVEGGECGTTHTHFSHTHFSLSLTHTHITRMHTRMHTQTHADTHTHTHTHTNPHTHRADVSVQQVLDSSFRAFELPSYYATYIQYSFQVL